MKFKLLVVADLGKFKAYRYEDSQHFSKPRLRLVEDFETNVTKHLSEELSDQAGRFRKGSTEGAAPLSDGEQHNIDLERRRRAVKAVAKRIGELMATEKDVDGCFFAADSRINQQILDELDHGARAKIVKNVHANLSNSNADQVISHFANNSH